MYSKSESLSSIPEKEEQENKIKWVPKKKHEVLKAKYKCLKKLFQIYDASVIGILPDPAEEEHQVTERRKSRRKRSHRTKTDAYAGTNEVCSGDVNKQSEDKDSSASSEVTQNLNTKCSCSTLIITEPSCEKSVLKITQMEPKNTSSSSIQESEYTQTQNHANPGCPINNPNNIIVPPHAIPYLIMNEKRKPTRFQLLMQRIFGIKREKTSKPGQLYTASDSNISHHYDRRRRRGLRFRRIRRPKKCHSDMGLNSTHNPAILSYVQSIQRSCLKDTTTRQCPIAGCNMVFYGIINYNDHLNLCHFTTRKYICSYCHDGFNHEYDKFVHENEHLGLNKLNQHVHLSATSSLKQSQKASITQTDQEYSKTDDPEEKLKKIVSFFDEIIDNEHMFCDYKKNRFLGSETERSNKVEESLSEAASSNTVDKRTMSCGNLFHRKFNKRKPVAVRSDLNKPVRECIQCHICGETFAYRRQLGLHVDLEHRVHDKFSKFHSCTGNVNCNCDLFRANRSTMQLEAGKINVQSCDLRSIKTSSSLRSQDINVNSEGSLSCDPSSNIIYFESNGKVCTNKIQNGISTYKWEPGTKIIRV